MSSSPLLLRTSAGSLAGAITLLALTSVTPVLAEEDLFEMSLERLARVKVTVASLFPEDEFYVGSSVSHVKEAQWQRFGAQRLYEAIEHVPGVYVSEHLNGMLAPTFRGYAGPNRYNSFLTLLDGMPVNNYSSASSLYGMPNFALGNLSSIEVIRGPGSALYGADAFNGVVSLNSWAPDRDEAQSWLEAGSFGYWSANGRLRQGVGEQWVLTSAFSASSVNDKGIDESYHVALDQPEQNAEVTGEYDNFTTTQKLALGSFEAGFYYSRNDTVDSFGNGQSGGFPNGQHSDGDAEWVAVRLADSFALPQQWQLDTSAYYMEDSLFGRFALFNTGSPPQWPHFDWDTKDNRLGVNLVAKRPFDEADRQWVLGYSYDQMESEHFRVDLYDTEPVLEDQNRDLHGVFAQVEQRLLDERLQLIAGVRYDYYSDFGDNASPRFGVIYHPIRDSALKLLYGNAFRAPSINEQIDNGVVSGGGDDMSPEKIDTWELIWMHAGEKWRYSLNTYYSELKDGINITLQTMPFSLRYDNTDSVKSYGAELEGAYVIGRTTLTGSISNNSAEQTEPVARKNYGPAFPDWMIRAGLEYAISPALTAALHHSYYYEHATLSSPFITPLYVNSWLPPVNRTDLDLRWRNDCQAGRCELYVTVRDVFDNADTRSAINLVETGTGTPGFSLVAGFKLLYE